MLLPVRGALLLWSLASPAPASGGEAPAFCSIEPPIKFSAERTRGIVDAAEIVVRVAAVGSATDPKRELQAWDSEILAFEVREVLKGEDVPDTIRFQGVVADWDDFQEDPVPYLSHRPRYSEGDCINSFYRIGAEYLLLLGHTPPDTRWPDGLTPYWTLLAPTNEQLRGPKDPWVVWVRDQVGRSKPRHP